MKPAGAAASTASVRWRGCSIFPSRRSATGRSATATIVPERSPGGHRLYSRDHVRAAALHRGGGCARPVGGRRAPTARRTRRGWPRLDARRPTRWYAAARAGRRTRSRGGGPGSSSSCAPRGTRCTLALAVGDAEEQWLESRPQLAIVELMISGGRGAELCRRLKQHDAGAVLAISVLQARDEALAAGADAFLQKPVDPLELVSTVKDLLGASALVARRGQGSA